MRKSALWTSSSRSWQRAPFWQRAVCALTLATSTIAMTNIAVADRVINPIAVFNGLDKITGRIVSFEVAINETIQFGSLQLTPRACYTRPPTEAPNTTAFIEVDELSEDNHAERLFAGWIFAASPGLHGIEHPVYDIWLTDCLGGNPNNAVKTPEASGANTGTVGDNSAGNDANTVASGNVNENNVVNIGDIDPYAPPPPPPRPQFEQEEDMQLDIDTLQTPLQGGQPTDILPSPFGD